MKIFLTGEENIGWALDTDRKFAEQALGRVGTISKNSWGCDFVHSVSPLTTYKEYTHYKDSFISVFPGEPKRLFNNDIELLKFCMDKPCVAQSKQAYRQLNEYGCKDVTYIPYIADINNFYPLMNKIDIRKKYNIPNDAFVICSFMRDSLGADLYKPKLEKGPDVFLDIIERLQEKLGEDKIVILLAGPRRHWIKLQLLSKNIRFIYVGKNIDKDDIGDNILKPSIINELLNASDLMIISSRTEGGPRGILEAGLAEIPVISTDVGIARDILPQEYIFNSVEEALELVLRCYAGQHRKVQVEISNTVRRMCSVDSVSEKWQEFYEIRMQNVEHKKVYAFQDIPFVKYVRRHL